MKNSLSTIDCLDLSFQYKGKDRLLAGSNETFNDFEIIKKPCEAPYSCADLVLGLSWLRLREAKIDIRKEGIKIYGNFVPFCKGLDNDEFFIILILRQSHSNLIQPSLERRLKS